VGEAAEEVEREELKGRGKGTEFAQVSQVEYSRRGENGNLF